MQEGTDPLQIRVNDSNFFQLRALSNFFNAEVNWDGDTGIASVTYENKAYKFSQNDGTGSIINQNGRLYLGIRAFTDKLGLTNVMSWWNNPKTKETAQDSPKKGES